MPSKLAHDFGLGPPATGRRRELLDAAADVVAHGGLRALTHRAVDAQAGLPEGSTSSSYRTRLALLTALMEHIAWLMAHRIEAARTRIADIPAQEHEQWVEEIVALAVDLAKQPRLVRVQAELTLEAVRTPELRLTFAAWRGRFLDLVGRIAEAVTPGVVEGRVETVVAAFQGVLTTSLIQPDDERAAYVERGTRQLLALVEQQPPQA